MILVKLGMILRSSEWNIFNIRSTMGGSLMVKIPGGVMVLQLG